MAGAERTLVGGPTAQAATQCVLANNENDCAKKSQDPCDVRECRFEGEDGNVTLPTQANLETGLKVGGLIMSSQ